MSKAKATLVCQAYHSLMSREHYKLYTYKDEHQHHPCMPRMRKYFSVFTLEVNPVLSSLAHTEAQKDSM